MKSPNRIGMQGLRFMRGQTVPGWRPLLLSFSAHCIVLAVLAWLFLLQRSAPVMVLPERTQIAQSIPVGPVSLPARSRGSPFAATKKRKPAQRPRNLLDPYAEWTVEGKGLQAVRERAQIETKALVQDFKFRSAYGFSPLPKYELAFQISGQMPTISADQLPPHYEQYVMVEVTIDSEGRVADAQIVSGEVDSRIQHTLLTAIRDFKYRPAMRDGIPVPSQCDLVVHIPT